MAKAVELTPELVDKLAKAAEGGTSEEVRRVLEEAAPAE